MIVELDHIQAIKIESCTSTNCVWNWGKGCLRSSIKYDTIKDCCQSQYEPKVKVGPQ